MKRKRERGYWAKKMETFPSGHEAKTRASLLRSYEAVQHVKVDQSKTGYVVQYSVAKWFVEECRRAKIKL